MKKQEFFCRCIISTGPCYEAKWKNHNYKLIFNNRAQLYNGRYVAFNLQHSVRTLCSSLEFHCSFTYRYLRNVKEIFTCDGELHICFDHKNNILKHLEMFNIMSKETQRRYKLNQCSLAHCMYYRCSTNRDSWSCGVRGVTSSCCWCKRPKSWFGT